MTADISLDESGLFHSTTALFAYSGREPPKVSKIFPSVLWPHDLANKKW